MHHRHNRSFPINTALESNRIILSSNIQMVSSIYVNIAHSSWYKHPIHRHMVKNRFKHGLESLDVVDYNITIVNTNTIWSSTMPIWILAIGCLSKKNPMNEYTTDSSITEDTAEVDVDEIVLLVSHTPIQSDPTPLW